jgi:transcriptional regulator with XRE-family HTH domain
LFRATWPDRGGCELSGATFGERLRSARLEAGLSQSELEVRSGIPKARLSRYENGHVLPSIGTLRKLASSLGVSEANLLGDQREIVDEFFHVLTARGVTIPTAAQARKLAEAVAGIYDAFGPAVPAPEEDGIATVAMADVSDAADAPATIAGPG